MIVSPHATSEPVNKMQPRLVLSLLVGLAAMSAMSEASAADQNVVVVLDDSASMQSMMRSGSIRKMDAAKQALERVLADVPDDADVGVLALNSRVEGSNWIVPLGPVERSNIQEQIGRIRAEGTTPLGVAMKEATDALLTARQKNVYGTYRLLIVTDGEASDQNLVDEYLPDIRSRGVITDVIGVAMSGQHSLATHVNSYRSADDPGSLAQAIAQVFAETSDTGDDAGDSDYELLGGVPDEVAAAAVESLTRMNNVPIGESMPVESYAEGSTGSSFGPGSGSGSHTAVPGQAQGGGVSLVGVCFGGFFLLFVFVWFLRIASKLAQQQRR